MPGHDLHANLSPLVLRCLIESCNPILKSENFVFMTDGVEIGFSCIGTSSEHEEILPVHSVVYFFLHIVFQSFKSRKSNNLKIQTGIPDNILR